MMAFQLVCFAGTGVRPHLQSGKGELVYQSIYQYVMQLNLILKNLPLWPIETKKIASTEFGKKYFLIKETVNVTGY